MKTRSTHIPFNKATQHANEFNYIQEAINSGVISGEGYFGEKCQSYIEELIGGDSRVFLTPSCTHALEVSALLLDLQKDDEVIMPSFTFVSTASAFALRGARPVFVDIEPTRLNIDPEAISANISPRTKAIVVVHYAGFSCEMERIMELAARSQITVIEDAAHALGATTKGRPLGSFGRLSAFSFHETKNVTCGEGGALVINDPALVDRARIICDKGTNRRKFQRGDVPFYSWVDLGSSYVMSDILAAFLYAQLEHLAEINERRRTLYRHYHSLLRPLKSKGHIAYPSLEGIEESGAHAFYILLDSSETREELRAKLMTAGITAVFHYQPLHRSSYVEAKWGKQLTLPVTENIAQRLLRLPLYYELNLSEIEYVVEEIEKFFKRIPQTKQR